MVIFVMTILHLSVTRMGRRGRQKTITVSCRILLASDMGRSDGCQVVDALSDIDSFHIFSLARVAPLRARISRARFTSRWHAHAARRTPSVVLPLRAMAQAKQQPLIFLRGMTLIMNG